MNWCDFPGVNIEEKDLNFYTDQKLEIAVNLRTTVQSCYNVQDNRPMLQRGESNFMHKKMLARTHEFRHE